MASQPHLVGNARFGAELASLVRHEGSFGHVWRRDHALLAGPEAARNLADVVHHMASLHAPHPGLIDLTGGGRMLATIGDRIADAFSLERRYLAGLVVAVGPLPGTPGQALSEAAVVGLRHALETLGRSDRAGCPCGAAAALLMDWAAVRPVLDAAAVRFGIVPAPSTLPAPHRLAAIIDESVMPVPLARAVGFGARQFLLQHHGLWDLLEARAHARRDA